MRKVLLVTLIVALVSTSAFAQGKRKGERREGGFKKELGLTAEQTEKMKALRQDYKAKQIALSKEHRQAVNAILTPEQQAKLKDSKVSKATKDKKWAAKGNHKRGGKMMKLDDATMSKLKALKENYNKEKEAIDRTRIAPDMQAKRKQELREKFRTERKQIIAQAKGKVRK